MRVPHLRNWLARAVERAASYLHPAAYRAGLRDAANTAAAEYARGYREGIGIMTLRAELAEQNAARRRALGLPPVHDRDVSAEHWRRA